jgi:hypothetical protein
MLNDADTRDASQRRKLRMEILRAKRLKLPSPRNNMNPPEHTAFLEIKTCPFEPPIESAFIEDKKEVRKLKNRQSAIASRQRKNDVICVLSSEIDALRNEVLRLKRKLSHYEDSEDDEHDMEVTQPIKRRNFARCIITTEPAVF